MLAKLTLSVAQAQESVRSVSILVISQKVIAVDDVIFGEIDARPRVVREEQRQAIDFNHVVVDLTRSSADEKDNSVRRRSAPIRDILPVSNTVEHAVREGHVLAVKNCAVSDTSTLHLTVDVTPVKHNVMVRRT